MDGKRERVVEGLRQLGGVVVAFSAGVDSTLLAALAVEALGGRALAVTGVSASLATREAEEAVTLAARIGIRHRVVATRELEREGYLRNAGNRCYFCKQELYTHLVALAAGEGLGTVVDGTNADDLGDVRPGRQAAAELGVRSPFVEAGVTKAEIRAWSRALDLPTADKPEMACLSSRVPEGTRITPELLQGVERAEDALKALGLRQLRVRHHGSIARIELGEAEMDALWSTERRAQVVAAVKAAGFRHVALDLEPYRRKLALPLAADTVRTP